MAREPLLIAGIGASAGGLDALQSLLRPLATDTGIAFVLVTHMARGVDSALPEILSRQTRMPVTVAADDARIEADHLYVCPPGCLLTVGGGRLRLQQDAVAHHKPIDVFLSSLAHDKGDAAIGILLSGGGSDGAIGIKHIKELGGLTIAQGAGGSGPKQSSMPDTAIAAGVVDLVLPVDDMPGRLAEYARNVRAGAAADDGEAARAAKDGYEPIYELLLEQVGHDFSGYKAATFARRVQRRMVIVQLDALAKYIDLLRWNSAEVRALFHDLLIGVTNFFRDPDAFAILEKTVIPKLFQDRGAGDAVRIWVPGCATGEEVYSLAMLVREHLDQLPEAPKVQLFATDIDEAALAVARAGRYPATTLASVSKP
ncbi:MAG: chemotaxis protein CheR, partial [Pseudomonadota bacterium]|nr:chemotaxis protein CheR [Pseudomonadota bacterium]